MSIPRYRQRGGGYDAPTALGVSTNLAFPWCDYINEFQHLSSARLAEPFVQTWDYLNPGPPYKVGYDFLLKRLSADYSDSKSVDLRTYMYRYVGKLGIPLGAEQETSAAFASYSETAGSFGAQAWRRARPTKPVLDWGQAFGELRDFPQLFRRRLKSFRDLGSTYLNVEFGWRPFLSDLLKTISLQEKIEQRIAFLRKNNGKYIRRTGTLRDEVTTETSPVQGCITPMLNYYQTVPSGSISQGTRTVIRTDRVWYDAMMKFWIDELACDTCKNAWSSPLLRRLYGLNITPSLLWELTPWTWLTDWFVNVGDLYANYSDSAYDNLVAKYAYVMRHRSVTVVISQHIRTAWWGPDCRNNQVIGWLPGVEDTLECSAEFFAECKERTKATTWGIGNDGESLSDRQLRILTALGLSRT